MTLRVLYVYVIRGNSKVVDFIIVEREFPGHLQREFQKIKDTTFCFSCIIKSVIHPESDGNKIVSALRPN